MFLDTSCYFKTYKSLALDKITWQGSVFVM